MKRAASIQRVAFYARVSTKDGRQDTENQLIALRDYCLKQRWEVVGEYVDQETGGHSRRPHFQRMFADARVRKFALVLFWSLDRLSREGVSATLNHLERLTAAGVNWRSYTEEYLDSTGLSRTPLSRSSPLSPNRSLSAEASEHRPPSPDLSGRARLTILSANGKCWAPSWNP